MEKKNNKDKEMDKNTRELKFVKLEVMHNVLDSFFQSFKFVYLSSNYTGNLQYRCMTVLKYSIMSCIPLEFKDELGKLEIYVEHYWIMSLLGKSKSING